MTTLPSRWQEILRREAAENVGTVLAQARDRPEGRRIPRWTVPALVVGVGSLSLLSVLGGSAPSGGSVPFDRSTVMSTRTAGLGASAEDLAPGAGALPLATPRVELPESGVAAPSPAPTPHRAVRDGGDRRRAARTESQSLSTAEPRATASPARVVPSSTINVGTRVEAVLTDPIVTGATFAPAAASLTQDVRVGDRVVLPAGTTLIGEGFATQQDNRAQVVFTAIVKDGKTRKFEGWALQKGEMGIKAKVIRKGSKAKKGAGTLLGAAAAGVSYGLAGAVPGPQGAALSSLGSTAASDLVGLGRDWRQSDKVVRVEAGVAITIYIRRDLTIE
jgi:hypothetical protein